MSGVIAYSVPTPATQPDMKFVVLPATPPMPEMPAE